MKRTLVIFSLLGLCLVSVSRAQMPAQTAAPSMSGDIKTAYNAIKNNLTLAAEKMPADGYSFQPTKEQRDFGGWVALDKSEGVVKAQVFSPVRMAPRVCQRAEDQDSGHLAVNHSAVESSFHQPSIRPQPRP